MPLALMCRATIALHRFLRNLEDYTAKQPAPARVELYDRGAPMFLSVPVPSQLNSSIDTHRCFRRVQGDFGNESRMEQWLSSLASPNRTSLHLLAQSRNFVDATRVSSTFKLGLQPSGNDMAIVVSRKIIACQTEHVRIVVLTA